MGCSGYFLIAVCGTLKCVVTGRAKLAPVAQSDGIAEHAFACKCCSCFLAVLSTVVHDSDTWHLSTIGLPMNLSCRQPAHWEFRNLKHWI